jgi:ABC-type bacteriocin/lantibiotic exporter with double-glycine peptidase domain
LKVLDFPSIRQTYKWDCGANVVQSLLEYYGIDRREDNTIKSVGTDQSGTSVIQIQKAFKKFGLNVYAGEMMVDDIKKYIDNKIPIIIPLQAWTNKKKVNWEENWTDGHYVVVIGYDQKKIYFEDPSSFNRTYLAYAELKKRWHDEGVDGKKYINWGIAVYGKKPVYNSRKIKHMD